MDNEVSTRVVLDLPREQAWEILRDLSRAHNYVPGIVRTEITSDIREGVGASRRVYQSETRGIDETVTEWRPGHGFLIRLHRGEQGPPPPFKEAAFRYQIDDAGNGQTALTTSLSYTMRWGFLGRLLQRYLLAGPFRATVRDVALGMKAYYESGEPTTPEKLKELKQREAERRAK